MSSTSSTSGTSSSQSILAAAGLTSGSIQSSSQITGLVSGLDTDTIINALLAFDTQQETNVINSRTSVNANIGLYQQLKAKMALLQTAAEALNTTASWKSAIASSTSSNVVATAIDGATGSATFTVDQLAKANTLVLASTFSSANDTVPQSTILLGKAANLGLASISNSGSVPPGTYTMTVTQASSGAKATANNSLPSLPVVSSGGTLDVTINGTPTTFNIADGSYGSSQQLVNAINNAAGGAFTASVGLTGKVSLTTTNEGSAQSLSVTGGTLATALGFDGTETGTGTDGIVTFDGQTTTINNIHKDGSNSATITGTHGNVDVTFLGGVRTGSATFQAVDTGTTVQSAINAINAAGAGVTAAAIADSSGQVHFQLSSSTTGVAGNITTTQGFSTLVAGQDAKLTIGEGVNAYSVSSSTNTVTGVLQNVSIQLTKADSNTPITISVAQDTDAMATKVKALVDAANDATKFIQTQTKFVPNASGTGKGDGSGPLIGDQNFQHIQDQILQSIDNIVGTATGAASSVGIKLNDTGTFDFDATKFKAALSADPNGVESLFLSGGSSGITDPNNPGIAERVDSMVNQTNSFTTGTLSTQITSMQSQVQTLTDIITDWDQRIAQKRTTLQRQWANLEVQLGQLKNISSQLANATPKTAASSS